MRTLNVGSRSISDICSRYEAAASSTTPSGTGATATSNRYRSSTYYGNNGRSDLQKSCSEVIYKRGFKPSDRHDPLKKQFLTSLSDKIWKKSYSENELSRSFGSRNEGAERQKRIDLRKLFTPAPDYQQNRACPRAHKKMYASSSFYSPDHPTVEEQLELARRISRSLSDISNQRSKGQTMYVNRKKKSVKWTHEGEGRGGPAQEVQSSVTEENSETKKVLKLVMNPNGQVKDLQTLQRMGYNIEPGALSPEVCFDLVKDMNATTGKGAELFAKRRKKSEKWVVKGNEDNDDATDVATSSVSFSESKNENFGSNSHYSTNSSYYQQTKHFNGSTATEKTDYFSEANNTSQRYPDRSNNNSSLLHQTPAPNHVRPVLSNGDNSRVAPNYRSDNLDLCKPKIPRGWNAPQPTLQPQVYNSDINSEVAATMVPTFSSCPNHYAFSEANNYNTAPRGWKPTMEYYRPVTFQKKHPTNTFTDF